MVQKLIASIIHRLHDLNVKFITATHFHELSKMDLINNLPNTKHYHLEVKELNGELIFDRKLKRGSGLGIYGIEIAKACNLDPIVINMAYGIRKELIGTLSQNEIIPTNNSRYNTKLSKSNCEIHNCGKLMDDVHHIVFQSQAKDSGFLEDGRHKNDISNLVNLCKYHHQQIDKFVRKKKLIINGWITTTSGRKLDYHYDILT